MCKANGDGDGDEELVQGPWNGIVKNDVLDGVKSAKSGYLELQIVPAGGR